MEMVKENTLFEFDPDPEFEDVFGDSGSTFEEAYPGSVSGAGEPRLAQPVAAGPDLAGRPSSGGLLSVSSGEDGGDIILPAISILLFCERSETRVMMELCAKDRRMGRATVDCHQGGIQGAIQYLRGNSTPDLLIVESGADSMQMLAEIDSLAEYCDENARVMVIGSVNDIMLYRQLMARGVSEYMVPPFQPLQMIRTLSSLFIDPESPFVGRQIAVIGAKGGVGSSTIAHNLAWSFSENIRMNTTLIDLDLSFGTTALDFNQETPQTVADALMAHERTDRAVVERLLARTTDRLSLFTAPASIGPVVDIPDEAYSSVIDVVRRNTPLLVLDLPHVWNGWIRDTLIASDEVIIVCQPDLASLRNGKNLVDQLRAGRSNDSPPRLVLNMCGVAKRPEIPVKDFASAIGLEPDIIIPFDPEVFGTAANNGQMISEAGPASKPAVAIDQLAGLLTGRPVRKQDKSFLAKLLRR